MDISLLDLPDPGGDIDVWGPILNSAVTLVALNAGVSSVAGLTGGPTASQLADQLYPYMSGPPGESAYQTWLDMGNTGTEADFLASLKGDPGTNGNNGAGLPTGGNTGQILLKASTANYDYMWADPAATTGSLPAGGTTGQILIKASGVNYDAGWAAVPLPSGLNPTGGSANQVLTKLSTSDYDYAWRTPATPSGLVPSGGTSGQLLMKSSSTNYDYAWYTYGVVPTTGATGTVLTRTGTGLYDYTWSDRRTTARFSVGTSGSPLSITSASWNKMSAVPTVAYNYGTGVSINSSTGAISILVAGVYIISGKVTFGGNSTGRRGMCYLYDTQTAPGDDQIVLAASTASGVNIPGPTSQMWFDVGTLISVGIYQDSGAALNAYFNVSITRVY